MSDTPELAAPAAAEPATPATPAALQPLLYEHDDGRYLVALAGNTIVADQPVWHRAGPVEIDPALLASLQAPVDIPALLQPGEWYAGPVLRADGSVQHHLIAADKTDGVDFDGAQAWARERGLSMPTKQEARLIVAHQHGRLDDLISIWTCEEFDSSYAWICNLGSGGVDDGGRSFRRGAVAVRRLVLQSFVA